MGNIYPCDSFVGNEEFRIGNIHTGINEDIKRKFEKKTIYERPKCKSCWGDI